MPAERASLQQRTDTADARTRAPEKLVETATAHLGNRLTIALGHRVGRSPGNPQVMRRLAASPVAAQRQIGNRAVAAFLQREFEDQGEQLQPPKPILEETGSGSVQTEGANEFGEVDGSIGSGVFPHFMFNLGQTSTDKWHHAAGGGGKGNQFTGDAKLVAPVYKSKPATATKPAKAWIKFGTGRVRVVRSYVGVVFGNNGEYRHAPGLTWITFKAKRRIAKHEREHVKKTRELHTQHIKPLEKRISKYRSPGAKTMPGTDEAAAIAALQAHVDWNTAVQGFATDDTTQNTPMGPVDTTDQARADFYFDFGPKKVLGKQYGHYVNTQ